MYYCIGVRLCREAFSRYPMERGEMMNVRRSRRVVVTGAFGFSGRFIARRLLARGDEVITLTNHPERDPFGGRVRAFPLLFEDG